MSKILSRFSELKAFLNSIFRITFSGFCSFSMRFRKTCAAISAPRLVPQPNCVPWKSIRLWSVAKELTHFEQSRRRVFPTAIGRIPQSFFRRPISLAPKKKGLKPTGTLPFKTIFSTLVSFWRNALPTDPLLFAIRSLYNWGTSRLGPFEDPEGKELIAFATMGSNEIRLSSTFCWA